MSILNYGKNEKEYFLKTSLQITSLEVVFTTLRNSENECVVKISLLHSLILEKGSRGFLFKQSFNNETSSIGVGTCLFSLLN
ncbi:hypothetical protein KUH03_22060 [Sphingobacterium sp. E70]|uniref:hypothetical protein n=1 Tax=Sphingobacterium sp. E70 TaxID=2853439 RepID=UPI00211C5EFE|nr:hypothetical protein [Sphingobacterium sp. E70]ULT22168.1 hypothetical protein KUH03_22060 [Sphingobacterium sp. E70]